MDDGLKFDKNYLGSLRTIKKLERKNYTLATVMKRYLEAAFIYVVVFHLIERKKNTATYNYDTHQVDIE